MVCTTRWDNAKGVAEGLTVFSYDAEERVYFTHAFKANGALTVERGHPIAGGFRFANDRGTGAERVRERLTLEEEADGRVKVVSETAKGDGAWVVGNRTEYLRTRP